MRPHNGRRDPPFCCPECRRNSPSPTVLLYEPAGDGSQAFGGVGAADDRSLGQRLEAGRIGQTLAQRGEALLHAVDGVRFACQVEQCDRITAGETRRYVALNAAGILHARKSFSTIPKGMAARIFLASEDAPAAQSRRA